MTPGPVFEEAEARARIAEQIRRILISRRGAKIVKGANKRAYWVRSKP